MSVFLAPLGQEDLNYEATLEYRETLLPTTIMKMEINTEGIPSSR